ncbi:MAG: DUF1801 domain-containing protein [Bacilli bacterium]|jgi:uncharacterized protein YdhG (YjbR/CyaY superfamily)|nr:DUF1801 domain-containing protein [Bacilli bacterium]HHU23537.1 hypothetical protein [Acholeplasmataceae bacterium]
MDKKNSAPQNIDEYIECFPPFIQEKLHLMRKTIKETAPEASEKISYSMPTFYLFGNLVHFSAMKNHIGFYPSPSGVANFLEELKEYHTSKGAIQFPYEKELPLDLIQKIVLFRVKENTEKALRKKKGK